MTLVLQDLRDDIRDELGLDSDDLDNTKVDKLIKRSWMELQNNFHFKEKESIYTFSTVAGTYEYTLAADHDSFVRVTVRDPDSLEETALERNDTDEFAENYSSDINDRSKPVTYTPRNANKLWFTPTPDKVYVISVYYMSVLPDITSGINPQEIYDILLYGAVWRGFMLGGDHNRGVSAKALQSSLIRDFRPREEKNEQDSRMAGIEFISEDNY